MNVFEVPQERLHQLRAAEEVAQAALAWRNAAIEPDFNMRRYVELHDKLYIAIETYAKMVKEG